MGDFDWSRRGGGGNQNCLLVYVESFPHQLGSSRHLRIGRVGPGLHCLCPQVDPCPSTPPNSAPPPIWPNSDRMRQKLVAFCPVECGTADGQSAKVLAERRHFEWNSP